MSNGAAAPTASPGFDVTSLDSSGAFVKNAGLVVDAINGVQGRRTHRSHRGTSHAVGDRPWWRLRHSRRERRQHRSHGGCRRPGPGGGGAHEHDPLSPLTHRWAGRRRRGRALPGTNAPALAGGHHRRIRGPGRPRRGPPAKHRRQARGIGARHTWAAQNPSHRRPMRERLHDVSPGDAALILAKRDPVIRRLVKEAGLPVFPKPRGTHFASLVQSITYQQLAGGAARAIHQRLVQVLHNEVTPERILQTSPSDLRQAGLSNSKVASIIDLGHEGRRAQPVVGWTPYGEGIRYRDCEAAHSQFGGSASGPQISF